MIGCTCEVCTSKDKRDNRLRSSILVRSEKTTICVDAGPDFRYQMLRAAVMELDGIVFTHPHKDHVAGLDDVRAYNFFSGKAMNIYANEMTEEVLIREFPYAFSEKRYPGVPEIRLNTIDLDRFKVGDIEITPIQVWHLRMPVLGFRFGKFTYITDANKIEEPEMEKIRGSEIVVVNALRHQKHISHFNLEEAIALSEALGSPETYFTHISHQLGTHASVEATLPSHVHLAYDGLSFSL
jgi:phosphoribosyl 1,2-cyclic phosphate phosphodiesterase